MTPFRRLPAVLLLAACGGDGGDPMQPSAEPATVEVTATASTALAALDATVQLAAVARDDDGDALDGRTFTWSSNATGVATVGPNGLVTAVGNGSAVITATTGGVSGSRTITVAQAASSLAVTPGAASVKFPGQTAAFAASVRDANGHALETQPAVAWSSGSEMIATVDASGTVTAVSRGATTITATTGALSETVDFDVTGETSFDFMVGQWSVESEFDDGVAVETTVASSVVTRTGTLLVENWVGSRAEVPVGVSAGLGPHGGVPMLARADGLQGVFTVVEGAFAPDSAILVSGTRLGGSDAERVVFTDMLGDSFTVILQRRTGSGPFETYWTLRYTRVASAPTLPAPTDAMCTAPEYDQFDFWLGDWNVRSGAQHAGTNLVHEIAGGCAVRENWVAAGGQPGTSFNMYDPRTGAWKQVWYALGAGADLELSGELVGSEMILAGPSRATANRVDRITWTPLGAGEVRQLWQASTDGGATFSQTVFDGTYSPR